MKSIISILKKGMKRKEVKKKPKYNVELIFAVEGLRRELILAESAIKEDALDAIEKGASVRIAVWRVFLEFDLNYRIASVKKYRKTRIIEITIKEKKFNRYINSKKSFEKLQL